MGAEKELDGSGHAKDAAYIVQAVDSLGRTVSRDPFKSRDEAEARAAELARQGHKVEVSTLKPLA